MKVKKKREIKKKYLKKKKIVKIKINLVIKFQGLFDANR